MSKPKTDRINISQPIDWIDAWRAAATTSGVDLSEWVGRQCNRALPKEVQEKLSSRPAKGRPKEGKSD